MPATLRLAGDVELSIDDELGQTLAAILQMDWAPGVQKPKTVGGLIDRLRQVIVGQSHQIDQLVIQVAGLEQELAAAADREPMGLIPAPALDALGDLERFGRPALPVSREQDGERVDGLYFPDDQSVRIISGDLAGHVYRSPGVAAKAIATQRNPAANPARNGWAFWRTDDGKLLGSAALAAGQPMIHVVVIETVVPVPTGVPTEEHDRIMGDLQDHSSQVEQELRERIAHLEQELARRPEPITEPDRRHVPIYRIVNNFRVTAWFFPDDGTVTITSGELAGSSYETPLQAALAVLSLDPPVQAGVKGWSFWRVSNGQPLSTVRRLFRPAEALVVDA